MVHLLFCLFHSLDWIIGIGKLMDAICALGLELSTEYDWTSDFLILCASNEVSQVLIISLVFLFFGDIYRLFSQFVA